MVENTLDQVVSLFCPRRSLQTLTNLAKISWYICTAAAGLFLVTRLFVRWMNMGGLFLDDYLICSAFCCLVVDLGIQQRMWNIGTLPPLSHYGIIQYLQPSRPERHVLNHTRTLH